MEQDIKLLIAKAEDTVRLSELRNSPKFMGFLSVSEATEISKAVKNSKALFFGGYDDAERRMFGVVPEYIEPPTSAFPIEVIEIKYRKVDALTHRDVLGSLMATGITRDKVGDIRFGDGFALVFVASEISDYLVEQVTKIGRVGVSLAKIPLKDVYKSFPPPEFEDITFTVSSTRLDAIISGLVGLSRTKAEQIIIDGLVFVNSFEVTKAIKKIKISDKITVRGYGKFLITETGNFSKKGREIIRAKKYI